MRSYAPAAESNPSGQASLVPGSKFVSNLEARAPEMKLRELSSKRLGMPNPPALGGARRTAKAAGGQ